MIKINVQKSEMKAEGTDYAINKTDVKRLFMNAVFTHRKASVWPFRMLGHCKLY